MIFIIGTRHSLQYWSDAIRNGEDCDADPVTVQQFEDFLQHAAITLDATIIAEELSQDVEAKGRVAYQSQDKWRSVWGCVYLYCDPDRAEREALSVSAGHEREDFGHRVFSYSCQMILGQSLCVVPTILAHLHGSWKVEG